MADQQAQRVGAAVMVPVEGAHGQPPVIMYADHWRAGGGSWIAHFVLPIQFLEDIHQAVLNRGYRTLPCYKVQNRGGASVLTDRR